MSNFSSLKAAIQQYIKTNGNEEITGAVLQDILLSMVSVLGDTAINDLETALQTETTNRTNADGTLQQNITAEGNARQQADGVLQTAINGINTKLAEGYIYAGIATTSTNPGTPMGKVFYIATVAGTYTNFSGVVLTQGINILKYNGSSWSSEQVIAIDDLPTAGSDNLAKSGGVVAYTSDFLSHIEKDYGQFCSKPLFSYGRIETDVTISDGYTIETPINKGIYHSQIIHNVIAIRPKNDFTYACMEYDDNGNYIALHSSSSSERTFNHKSIRLQAGGSQGTIEEITNNVDVITSQEKNKLNLIDKLGSEKIAFLQGGISSSAELSNTPNFCHSVILKNIKSVTPASGYSIAVRCLNSKGVPTDEIIWNWFTQKVDVPITVNSVIINLKRTDGEYLSADYVNTNLSSIIAIESYEKIFSELIYQGYTRRNVTGDINALTSNSNMEVNLSATNRIHSGFIDNCIAISANEGYQISVMIQDELGVISNQLWGWRQNIVFDKEYRVRFNIRKTNDADLSNIIDEVLSNVFVYTSTKYVPKKISILGDSLSTYGSGTTEHPDPQENYGGKWTYPRNLCRYPQDNLFNDVDHMWWKLMMDNYGFSLGINDSWRSTTVSSDRENCMSDQTRISHLGVNGTPNIIFIFAGTNDAGLDNPKIPIGTFNTEDPSNYTDEQIAALPSHTFADAYRTMLIRLMKTYPDAEIIAIMPDFTTAYYTMDELDPYIEMIREVCDFFGVQTIDLRMAGVTPFNKAQYLPDNIHFNRKGSDLVYYKIAEYLNVMKI